ncbi:hypothetical protein B0H10DRAFT_2212709 [Mycena sp. CBHHK59/15]|nr:hypothetical protein B0H10DRAFT_2212709 [Mycena sp. CBHHK59/15]
MSLSMPIHEFSRLRLTAILSPTGHISLSFKPLEGVSEPFKDLSPPDLTLHVECATENGVNQLSVYLASNAPASRKEQLNPPENVISDGLENADASIARGRVASPTDIWPAHLFEDPAVQAQSENGEILGQFGTSQCNALQEGQLFQDGNYDFDVLCGNYESTGWLDTQSRLGTHPVQSPTDAFLSLPTPPTSSVEDFGNHRHQFSDASSPSAASSSGVDSPAALESDHSSRSKRSKLPCHHRTCKQKLRDKHVREVPMVMQTKVKQTFAGTFAHCSEIFSRKHDRLRHEVTQHGTKCEWVCHKCRKFFASEKTLTKHGCSTSLDTRWVVPSDGGISA